MYNYKAKCVRIIGGDTLDLEIDLGFNVKIKERIRLARVNTPEIRGSEQGLVAAEFVDVQIFNQNMWNEPRELEIATSKVGKFGRWIAEVYYVLDGEKKNLSDVLIKEGLAQEVNYG